MDQGSLTTVGREALLDALRATIHDDARAGRQTGLLVLEIKQYKRIHVTYGHDRTRRLLAMLMRRLVAALPRKDGVFYRGGDEIVVVLRSLRVREQLNLAINKIRRIIAEPLVLYGNSLRIGLTVGATASGKTRISSEDLLHQAHRALLEARDRQLETVVYTDSLDDREVPSLELQSLLSDALERNELTTVFQPKVDIRTGEVIGVESLSRWNSHLLGPVRPDRFIDAAENSGLIGRLTIWTINNAAKQYSLWGEQAVPIAVNLSAAVINSPELQRQLRHALSIWGMPPEALSLEITETAVMEAPGQSMESLRFFADMGIRLALDDFGTGYSSLAYLKMLPVTDLKIDKSFVQNLASDASDRKIVKTIIDMAHNFDLKVIAEGVEDEASYRILMDLGCDIVQGYLVSKPLKPEHFRKWLLEDRWYRPARAGKPQALAGSCDLA